MNGMKINSWVSPVASYLFYQSLWLCPSGPAVPFKRFSWPRRGQTEGFTKGDSGFK
jgi:hypothetical protein